MGKMCIESSCYFKTKITIFLHSRVNKIALNRDDDKRIIDADLISTKARGHYAFKYEVHLQIKKLNK